MVGTSRSPATDEVSCRGPARRGRIRLRRPRRTLSRRPGPDGDGLRRDRDVAEEVVQEAWIAVIRGVDRFEGRRAWPPGSSGSSRTRPSRAASASGAASRCRASSRDGRTVGRPVAVPDAATMTGHWATHRLLGSRRGGAPAVARDAGRHRRGARDLPPAQRTVMTLRDIRASIPRRCAPPWRSAPATSGCCSTGPGRGCGLRWNAIRRGRGRVTHDDEIGL